MNSYRLHIRSDERGRWKCLIRAASVDDAIRYGEQVFPESDISVSKVASPPQKKAAPVPDTQTETVWGFSRRELATLCCAVIHFASVLEYLDENKQDVLRPRSGLDWLDRTASGPDGTLKRLNVRECEALGNRIHDTLTMEATDMDGPF